MPVMWPICKICKRLATREMSGPGTNFEVEYRCDWHAHPIMRLSWRRWFHSKEPY